MYVYCEPFNSWEDATSLYGNFIMHRDRPYDDVIFTAYVFYYLSTSKWIFSFSFFSCFLLLIVFLLLVNLYDYILTQTPMQFESWDFIVWGSSSSPWSSVVFVRMTSTLTILLHFYPSHLCLMNFLFGPFVCFILYLLGLTICSS